MADQMIEVIKATCEAISALPPMDASQAELSRRGLDHGKYDKTLPIRKNLSKAAAFLEPFCQEAGAAGFSELPRPIAELIITELDILRRIASEIPEKCRPDPTLLPAVVPPSFHGDEMTIAGQVETVFGQLYLHLVPLRGAQPGPQPSDVENPIDLSIAYILFLDIVGYSRLLNEEQRAVVERLTQIVRRTNEVQAAEAKGELIKIPTGDGMALVFYRTPEEPARCAVEISTALRQQSDLQVRMGIHSGPVKAIVDINGKPNVTGAGINMAQRVMDCGDAGHILLSKHVAEDLEHYSEWKPYLHDTGEVEVKHGVRIFVVNLQRNDVGNPNMPARYRDSAAAKSQRKRSTPTSAKIFESQLREIEQLEKFIGGKNESELWELFDLNAIARFNIRRAKAVVDPIALTSEEAIEIDRFFGGGQAILNANYRKVTRTAGGFKTEPIPGKLGILNLSKKYVESRQTLSAFESSARLPDAIQGAIRELDQAVSDNAQILLDIINEKLAQNPEHILHEEDRNSALFGATSGAFLDRCVRLKLKQEAITSQIRAYLKIE